MADQQSIKCADFFPFFTFGRAQNPKMKRILKLVLSELKKKIGNVEENFIDGDLSSHHFQNWQDFHFNNKQTSSGHFLRIIKFGYRCLRVYPNLRARGFTEHNFSLIHHNHERTNQIRGLITEHADWLLIMLGGLINKFRFLLTLKPENFISR